MSPDHTTPRTRAAALTGNQNARTTGDYSRATPPDPDALTRRALIALAHGDTDGLRELRRILRYHGHHARAAQLKKLAHQLRGEPPYIAAHLTRKLEAALHEAERIEEPWPQWPEDQEPISFM